MKKATISFLVGVICFLMVIIFSLAGCKTAAEETGEATGEVAEETVSGEKKVVTFTWNDYDGVKPEFYIEFETAFEKENPDIDLQLITLPWSETETRIQTMVAGGEPPDLSHIGTRMILNYMDLGIAEPVENWISDELFNDIIPGTKEAEIGGVLWGMPLVAAARINFYRNDLVPEPPKTFEEMKEIAKQVSNPPDIYGIGMTGRAPYVELTEFVYYFYGAGGDFFEVNDDGSLGKCTVNSEAGVKALTFMNTLVKEGLTQPTYLADWRDEVLDLFVAGKIAIYPTGAFLDSMLQSSNVDFSYDYTTMPYFEGTDDYATVMITDTVMMFNASEVKAEAGKVLDYLFTPEWVVKYSKQHGFPGTTKSSAEDEWFQTPIFKVLNQAAENSKGWPLIPEWTECNDIIWMAIGEVYGNDADPKEALDEAAKKIDELRGIE